MKKSFLLIALLLMFGSSMFAQDIDFGVKLGYQTSHLSYKQSDIKSDFLDHMTFGLFGRVEIGWFYIEPEILYFKSGDIFELTAENISEGWSLPEERVTFTLNEANLQVPILLGARFLDLGVVTFRAQVGPTANFTLASNTLFDKTFSLTDSSGDEQTFDEGTNLNLDTKKIAWGFQAGLGLDILGKITLDVNYNFGLSSLFNALGSTSLSNYFDFSNMDNTKKNMFLVTVGYKFL